MITYQEAKTPKKMFRTGIFTILVIAIDDEWVNASISEFILQDFDCTATADIDRIAEIMIEESPDLVLIDVDLFQNFDGDKRLLRRLRTEEGLLIIGLVSENQLQDITFALGLDDFIIKPCRPCEVVARARHLFWLNSNVDNDNLIKYGDLLMDLTSYEVYVGNRLINLSFKEYELLKVLVNNRGRVMSRQVLLDKIWGYDYYGGDRTVDVHIRRLRSKIEDANHSFIDTVRNVGYRFKTSSS